MAGVLSAWFAYDLMRMPVQISDSLSLLLDVQRSSSLFDTFATEATRGALLRPAFHVQIEILFDLADGHYWLVFRGFHAALVAMVLFLFVRALRVTTWIDVAAAVLALTVLTGLHTFRGMVREAFVINHFLEVAVFCLFALNLAQSRGGWWVDLLATVTFVVASLTLESGLLVWVVLVTAWATGLRGVSRRGVIAVTGLLAVYMYVRFFYLSVALEARSSGFLFRMLEYRDIQDLFGADHRWFYAYNVATSLLSVLFSDPDGGVFEIGRAWLQGYVPPRLYVAVASSLLTTGLILWAVIRRLRSRGLMMPTGDERFFVISAGVLMASAAMSYAYTKHEILSTAGVFYALAVFVAARQAVLIAPRISAVPRTATCLLLTMTATIWAFRSTGVHHMLQMQGFKERNDWARFHPDGLVGLGDPSDERARALVAQLRRDALEMRMANMHVLPRWADRWWGE